MRQIPITTAPPDVVFWTSDKGGTRYYRCEQPANALREMGYRTQVAEVLCPSWGRAPTIVGHRVASPKSSILWAELAEQAKRTGQRLVYDADDNYLEIDPSNEMAYATYSKPEVKQRIIANIQAAGLVTVCSPYLAGLYGQYHDNVVITTNTLPAAFSLWNRPRREKVVVGWAGSEASHAELEVIAPVLRQLAHREDVEVHLIGIPQHVARSRQLSSEQGIRVTPWVWGTENYLTTVDFDLWLAPMRDTPFNAGKFPTKVMEASVLGIPLLVSAVGQYPERIGHGGQVVRDDRAWGHAVYGMLSSRGMLKLYERATRADAARWYTECNAQQWARSLIHA